MPTYQADRREVRFEVGHAAFAAALEGLLGRTDLHAFNDIATATPEAARKTLTSFVGPLDFSLFQKIDHGGLRTAMAGKPTRATTYVFGNALIAVQMSTHDARAGLYVPLRLFVQEAATNRVAVTYDLPSATLGQFGVPAIDEVARSLDDKVQRLLDATVARAAAQGQKLSSNVSTQFLEVKAAERYAYRRFGSGRGLPLLLLQHFTGTLDNWDPALTNALADGRELILFDNAGIGRSSGSVPTTVAGMAKHAAAFLEGLGVTTCDVLGFSLGGMVAQQMVLDRPAIFRRLILVGTAPRGGEDIMHLDKPRLAKYLQDPSNKGYSVLQKIFFTLTPTGQAAGASFIERLAQRTEDFDRASGPEIAAAQVAAFRDWERSTGEPFADLRAIRHPTLVVNGVHDEMIPVANSYRLSENLPNAVLLTCPDAGHGSLFQYHESFARHASAFLSGNSESAVY